MTWKLEQYHEAMKVGRPGDRRRMAYIDRFGLTQKFPWRLITHSLMDRLDACKDDEARKVLLGIREPL
jgi:hypothetical protein